MGRLIGANVMLPTIRIKVGEALASPRAHTRDAWELGSFLRFVGVGGMGPPSGQLAARPSQSWKGLAHPLPQTPAG